MGKHSYCMVIKVLTGKRFVDTFVMDCSPRGLLEDSKVFRDKVKELRSDNRIVKIVKRITANEQVGQ